MFSAQFTSKVNQKILPFGVYEVIAPLTASPSRPYTVVLPKNILITNWYQAFIVGVPNDSANYWTIDLISLIGGLTNASFNTSAFSAGSWNRIAIENINSIALVSNIGVFIRCIKTGAPGALYLSGPYVTFY